MVAMLLMVFGTPSMHAAMAAEPHSDHTMIDCMDDTCDSSEETDSCAKHCLQTLQEVELAETGVLETQTDCILREIESGITYSFYCSQYIPEPIRPHIRSCHLSTQKRE